MRHFILLPLIALVWAAPAPAQWPTTIRENLPVAADTSMYEGHPVALPFTNGSTLVVFYSNWGNCYQILSLNGYRMYETPQRLAPAHPGGWGTFWPQVVLDSTGGAIAAWYINDDGYYAQRLDANGNRLWGDAALRFGDYRESSNIFGLCPDGQGGFYYAADGHVGMNFSQVHVYHVSAMGELLWGGLSGIPVAPNPNYYQEDPAVCPDGQGGVYVIWEDTRPPYGQYPALFGQHLDSSGTPLWAPLGQVVHPYNPWMYDLIPDGEGGFILHTGGSTYNWAYRYAPEGTCLWSRDHVSWYNTAVMVRGEPGFFYLGFKYHSSLYAQRMDMQGNLYWPTWGSGQPGNPAILWSGSSGELNIGYRSPYLFCVNGFGHYPSPFYPSQLRGQKLDAAETARVLLTQAGWVLALLVISRIAWSRGLRRYAAFGG